jgi:hypothetical protein
MRAIIWRPNGFEEHQTVKFSMKLLEKEATHNFRVMNKYIYGLESRVALGHLAHLSLNLNISNNIGDFFIELTKCFSVLMNLNVSIINFIKMKQDTGKVTFYS